MMNRRNTIAAALASALLLPFSAFAAEPFPTVVGEAAVQLQYVPNTVSHGQVLEELRAAQRNPVIGNGWRFVGGEAGWSLERHRLTLDQGQLVHAQDCTLNPARPGAQQPAA